MPSPEKFRSFDSAVQPVPEPWPSATSIPTHRTAASRMNRIPIFSHTHSWVCVSTKELETRAITWSVIPEFRHQVSIVQLPLRFDRLRLISCPGWFSFETVPAERVVQISGSFLFSPLLGLAVSAAANPSGCGLVCLYVRFLSRGHFAKRLPHQTGFYPRCLLCLTENENHHQVRSFGNLEHGDERGGM